MKLKPIFDTNVFGDLQRGLIADSDWKFLLRHSPGNGWPLSQVTALELLAAVHLAPNDFTSVRRRIEIAYHLSSGKVLEDPRILICKDVLRIPFPADQLAPAASTVSRYMDGVRRALTLNQLLNNGVSVKGMRFQIKSTSVLGDLMAGPKKQWMTTLENTATEKAPGWRDVLEKTGRRLPAELRQQLEPMSAWDAQRASFINSLLNWLHADVNAITTAELSERLDAVIEFTIFVVREFLLRNYNPKKHDGDVFDQFQLQYLAMDRFVIVSRDSDLSNRTQQSSQADRIMSFDQFLRTL